jgi:hypothetical protein
MSRTDKKEFPIYGIENNLPEEKNAHIHIAVGFFDALARVQTVIPRSVWRLFWFVVRKTLGFQGAGKQKGDFLSCRQISGGIGTQRQTVPRLIRCGEKLNLIHVGRDKDGKLLRNPKTGQRGYFITPNMNISTWKVKLSPPKVSHPTASPGASKVSHPTASPGASKVSHPTASQVYLRVNTPGVITHSDTLIDIKKEIQKEDNTPPAFGKYLKMASSFAEERKAAHPDIGMPHKKEVAEWAEIFRQMVEDDGRDPTQIKSLILWFKYSDFWEDKIYTPKTIREKFDKLIIARDEDRKKGKIAPEEDMRLEQEERERIHKLYKDRGSRSPFDEDENEKVLKDPGR